MRCPLFGCCKSLQNSPKSSSRTPYVPLRDETALHRNFCSFPNSGIWRILGRSYRLESDGSFETISKCDIQTVCFWAFRQTTSRVIRSRLFHIRAVFPFPLSPKHVSHDPYAVANTQNRLSSSKSSDPAMRRFVYTLDTARKYDILIIERFNRSIETWYGTISDSCTPAVCGR